MNTKLTLRLDDHLIKSAKEYSAQTGKSVSKIVSDSAYRLAVIGYVEFKWKG